MERLVEVEGESYLEIMTPFSLVDYVRDHLAEGEIAYGLETTVGYATTPHNVGWATDGTRTTPFTFNFEDAMREHIAKEFGTLPQSSITY